MKGEDKDGRMLQKSYAGPSRPPAGIGASPNKKA